MRTSLKATLAAAVAVGALVALAPAIGQDRPESILPPGFGEPTPAPAPRPTAPAGTQPTRSTGPSQPTTPPPSAAPAQPGAMIQPLPPTTPGDAPPVPPVAAPAPVDPAVLAQYEMPESARRSLATVGPVMASEGGLDTDAFGSVDGQYVETLMRRLNAPLPSRWMSILLRRALVSRVDTPSRTNGADFAAERAWLLLRMGESVAARAVTQSVDTDNYTPKLYDVAMNASLATGDPAGLCPLVPGAMRYAAARGWTMAQAMCAGLSGNPARATPLIATAKRRNVASGVDMLLAQKVVGAGAQGRQAVTIEWDGVDQLTAWRFGLAMATGVAVPDDLYASAGPQVKYWQALSPSVPLGARLAPAESAAGQGVLSSAALVDLYAAAATDDDTQSTATAAANDLQTAYADRSPDARLNALRQLWGGADTRPAYARLVLTARAAARMNPALAKDEADHLIASMLSAGLDRTAARWLGTVPAGGDAWAMIMLSDPDAYRRLSYADLASYSGGEGDSALKQRMLFAGLAGLGRLNSGDIERAAQSLGVRIGADNAWTRALDRAARDGQAGTVVVLAAIGMQAPDWKGIPPEALYRIVGALRAVGLDGEARMIAAEAIARA
ncbi:hypothetical protein C8J46_104413 [Sphingomonas sp. PP-F2F-A104-K0414]|uniref:hypothetical protein n=1 Tax=Sphingomonas sp. PP-F2F-A104-K0414 TaxID=2135661 RepID=UPI001048DD54|nr:hypothetical protein [Sphingomonas sp. PP-F2F-A104-K0414]TCP98863.1 hypothetical protein C8J46_104413 [Sphingomonas sp. PP-F2F-A104-K0414]